SPYADAFAPSGIDCEYSATAHLPWATAMSPWSPQPSLTRRGAPLRWGWWGRGCASPAPLLVPVTGVAGSSWSVQVPFLLCLVGLVGGGGGCGARRRTRQVAGRRRAQRRARRVAGGRARRVGVAGGLGESRQYLVDEFGA